MHGPAVVPGKPDDSLILRMMSGDKPMMPMQGMPLSPAQADEIPTWIEQGAPRPENLRGDRKRADLRSRRRLRQPPVPAADSTWVRTAIDASGRGIQSTRANVAAHAMP